MQATARLSNRPNRAVRKEVDSRFQSRFVVDVVVVVVVVKQRPLGASKSLSSIIWTVKLNWHKLDCLEYRGLGW